MLSSHRLMNFTQQDCAKASIGHSMRCRSTHCEYVGNIIYAHQAARVAAEETPMVSPLATTMICMTAPHHHYLSKTVNLHTATSATFQSIPLQGEQAWTLS